MTEESNSVESQAKASSSGILLSVLGAVVVGAGILYAGIVIGERKTGVSALPVAKESQSVMTVPATHVQTPAQETARPLAIRPSAESSTQVEPSTVKNSIADASLSSGQPSRSKGELAF
jgi:fatty acid/phospholipid biosynthesis enzyme